MTPLIGDIMSADGVIHLSSSVVVRNEPNGSVWETLPGG
jgi:hypothetical protein